MSPDVSRRPDEAAGQPDAAAAPASRRRLAILGIAAVLVTAVLLALGLWQVQRLSWKLDLIARVDARVHAAPVAAPGPAAWPSLTASGDEYRHVTVTGTFLHTDETLVQAATERGPGFWVMTPLRRDDGTTVLINRGFVPPERRDVSSRAAGNPSGSVTLSGLLRITEPKGGFLRSNDPAGGRWYSRDVAAIAAAHSLSGIAPYFIDADAAANPGGFPVGGLTRVVFPNNHLVYAITWFALAAMLAAAIVLIGRREWRRTHP